MEYCRRVLVVSVILISLALDDVVGRRCEFPAIYNFGDSNSDTGGISATFGPIPPPYGSSFFGKPAGRESDGRLIIDFIAEHLGLPYLSSYLDSIGTSFRHGANFAAGGSTIRRKNDTIFDSGISPFSLDIQMLQFDQFKSRTIDLYHRGRNMLDKNKLPQPNEFSRALYIIDIGQNDLVDGFRTLTTPQLQASLPNTVEQLAAAITHLYEQGARTFWIHNVGPIGCLPAATVYVRNPKAGFLDENGCIRNQNAMAAHFNALLKARVTKLREELPRASLVYVDVYSAKYLLISNTTYYGFGEAMKICCGRHDGGVEVWCGQRRVVNGEKVEGVSCRSPESYVSWDGVHYSQAANQWIADRLLTASFSDPPTPIASACLKR
ncbi:GDSL-like Lipase/Acylhydrolase superfamily protein [Perilla frutescens var. hirtella]|uniref:GDSL-like Lipase/Acylhydrolase superfamily protein n=1 Tax=Perilla frutescens var. hirtella TaxID=608512 RepID=A0AAD4PBH6_PERFH|nr:GDSL-like Lipase/Acylhydrolase superfamily protein [Perilla frutescens var. hirtella]